MGTPLVSVLLPFYNAEHFLSDAIRSILEQSFTDFELLLLDDGSTDRSLDIVKQFDDVRIKLIQNNKNIGLIDTLNKGIDSAKGCFIARMDADDISMPKRFEKQVEYMLQNQDVIACGTQIEYFGTSSGTSQVFTDDAEIKVSLLYGPCFVHPTVMMRSNILHQNKIYYSKKHIHMEDYDLWLRIMPFGKFANLNETLLKYRIGEQNITIKNKATRELRLKEIFADVLALLDIDPTEENKQLMLELSYNTPRIINYKKLYKFKQLIIKQNETKRIWNQTTIKKIVNQKWARIYYIAADNGINETMRYTLAGGHVNFAKIKYQFSKFRKK